MKVANGILHTDIQRVVQGNPVVTRTYYYYTFLVKSPYQQNGFFVYNNFSSSFLTSFKCHQ